MGGGRRELNSGYKGREPTQSESRLSDPLFYAGGGGPQPEPLHLTRFFLNIPFSEDITAKYCADFDFALRL